MGFIASGQLDSANPDTSEIKLVELLSALSHALDMTEGQPAGHCMRCCWIGLMIAVELKLSDIETFEVCYTILLKDLGCSSNAARICELYLVDDIAFKQDFKRIDGSLPQALRFVLSHTGLKSGLAERFHALIKIFKNGGSISRELIETRCQRGAEIARRLRFGGRVSDAIAHLDEHWDGNGKPAGLARKSIPLYSQIGLLAQVVDVFQQVDGELGARLEIENRSGSWFDPELVAVFKRISLRPSFWDSIRSEHLIDDIFSLLPASQGHPVDDDYLDQIAEGFAAVVDAKSSFTAGHSERVALYADLIASELSLSEQHRRWLKRAALLHDIGKLGVSNSILDKPGKLDEGEWAQLRQHAVFSEIILSRVAAFRSMAPIAAAHHERIDGKGYPKGLKGDEIALESRILAVADIFDALTADRPYRAAMSVAKAFSIIDSEVGVALDGRCVTALKAALRKNELAEVA